MTQNPKIGSSALPVLSHCVNPPRNQCSRAMRNISPKIIPHTSSKCVLFYQASSGRFLFIAEYYKCGRANIRYGISLAPYEVEECSCGARPPCSQTMSLVVCYEYLEGMENAGYAGIQVVRELPRGIKGYQFILFYKRPPRAMNRGEEASHPLLE